MTDRVQLDRWMASAADGDRAALEPLFHALWPIVAAYTQRLVGPQLAEDCAQDALVKLFAQLAAYDPSRDALTWALTIATWECRTVRRKLQRRAECADVPEIPVDGVTHAEDRELVREALAALATLAPRDVDVIVAAITDDDDARTALAPATFRKRLERALARLRLSWRSRHESI